MELGQHSASEGLADGALIAGRYRVQAALGRGAAGAVYRVQDERSGALLALKRLEAPTAQRALFAAQFEREYHTLCQLAHPSIIEVYDFGIDGDAAFYTMELLEGPELRKLCPLPWKQACELLRDVASSLAVLHSRRLLHRDISLRNVRLTSSGRAKLLDFGAMTAMGPCKHMVGTPPFVPPEALALQALDARADLYALGALAYYMLTRRYAYPVRSFRELQAAFARPPQPIGELNADVPPPLIALVDQLQHLDRELRPASAAEVMERLSGIAGLPLREHAEVSLAYLATPALVGRERAQHHVDGMLRAVADGGGCLLIEGEAGVGRSRVLDAAVLRAKLLGMSVVRGDAGDGGGRPYGLIRALCAQLFELLPEPALRQASLQQAALAQVIDLPGWPPPPAEPSLERRHLHAALRDFVRALARSHPIAIAVDDVELCDEPSAAVLAAIGHGAAKRKLALLLTTCTRDESAHTSGRDASPPPALALIREVAERCRLAPLSAAESEALLRSVFGDAEHLPGLAQRAHQLSGGNPRWLMLLAEHLVDRGVARYEAGSWTLPAALPAHALPESLTAALHARIAALPEPARELGRCLALTDLALLAPTNLARLLGHGDARRKHAALDALLAAGVLISAGERFRFAQPELAQALREGLPPEQERELHARLAQAMAGSQDPIREAHHLAFGGREHDAIALMLPRMIDAEGLSFSRLALALLERLYLTAERDRLPLITRSALRSGLLAVASLLGDRERFLRYAEPVLAELLQASGLHDYAALGDVPEEQRLAAALTRLQERFDATPEPQRGLPPVEAITELARLYSMYVSIAVNAQELALLEHLPPLNPLAPLSPALTVVQALVDGMRDFLAGRYNRMRDAYRTVLERIEQPDHAGLDPAHYATARLGLRYLQGVFAAAIGNSAAIEWVVPLAEHPGHRVNALRVHMALALIRGDVESASISRRKADLLALQDGGQVPFPSSTERIIFIAQVHAEDVVSIKRMCERAERSAAEYNGWAPNLVMARAQYLRLQGDPSAALELLLPTLDQIHAGRHLDWPWLVAIHVQLLVDLGRFEEAAERGERYYARCVELGIDPGNRFVVPHLVTALCALGRHERARLLAERSVKEEDDEGGAGAQLVVQLEACARAALGLGDGPRLRELAERCTYELRHGPNRALRARLLRLYDEARARGLGAFVPEPDAGPALASAAPTSVQSSGTAATLPRTSSLAPSAFERLANCIGSDERQLELARLVLDATGAEQCWLFALAGGGLELVAATPERDAPASLAALLERHLRAQLQNDDTMTAVLADDELPTTSGGGSGVTRSGPPELLSLQLERDGQNVVVGAAALRFGATRNPTPDRAALEAVASALLDDHNADCVTRCQ